jgi:hypothetical protein
VGLNGIEDYHWRGKLAPKIQKHPQIRTYMELHTHNPQHVYNPAWGASTVAKLYDQDLYAWANTNAQLLREKKYDQLDMTNLIEELDSMAKSEQRGILSHLKILLMHLLKWEFQPSKQTSSWRLSIRNARESIEDLIADSPSLHSRPAENLLKVYAKARQDAADDTDLPLKTFPIDCPYTIEQVLDESWLPA